ncbi:hypothetical protein Tco_0158722 [Tanacetum coccineum]
MKTLQFADTHNLAAFLAKPAKSDGFKQIATGMVKMVNGNNITSLLYRKKIVFTEASVRKTFIDDKEGGMFKFISDFYVTPSHTKKIFANMRRQGKDFSGKETPLFPTMVVQAQEEIGEGSTNLTDPYHTPIITQPSSSQPQKKHKSRRPKEKDTQNTKTAQAQEITSLKKRVNKLEKKGGSITHKLKRLYKVGISVRIVSSYEASLEQGVPDSKKDDVVQVNTAATTVSTASTIPVSAAIITKDKITLAQALAELNSKVTTATTATTKGILLSELSESITTTTTTIPLKDKGNGIMVKEPLKMKKKDQINFDKQEAIRLQAEFDKEVRLAREKDKANVALIKEWSDIQVKIDADYQLAQRLQAQEQEESTIEERAKLFQQLLEKRIRHFAAKRAEEKRNRLPTKAQ